MIPKIIYTCWLNDIKTMPQNIRDYVQSQLEYHKDYKHVIIGSNEFNKIMHNLPKWVLRAYENKDYAHVSDYLRVYYVYKYGGIYIDSDIENIKQENIFDKYLKYDFFANLECSTNYYPVQYLIGDQYTRTTTTLINLNDPAFSSTLQLDLEQNIKDKEVINTFLYKNNNYNLNLIKSFYYGTAVDGSLFGASKDCSLLRKALEIYNSPLFEHYVEDIELVGVIHYYPNVCHILAKTLETYGYNYGYEYGRTYLFNGEKYLLNTDKFISITDFKNRKPLACETIHMCAGSWRK